MCCFCCVMYKWLNILVFSEKDEKPQAPSHSCFTVLILDHITPFLIKLHWLPAHFRIQFKILLLVFKALESKASVDIRDLMKPKVAGGYTLRSDNLRLLQVPKTKCKSFGDRAFTHSGQSLWNALPLELRLISNIDCFKRRLKTYLFEKGFKPEWFLFLFIFLSMLHFIMVN